MFSFLRFSLSERTWALDGFTWRCGNNGPDHLLNTRSRYVPCHTRLILLDFVWIFAHGTCISPFRIVPYAIAASLSVGTCGVFSTFIIY